MKRAYIKEHGLCRLVKAALSAGLLSGCFLGQPFKTTTQREGSYLVHVVATPSESAQQISQWYIGGQDGGYIGGQDGVELLKGANPTLDLSAMKPGDLVLVPMAAVKRTLPLGSVEPSAKGKSKDKKPQQKATQGQTKATPPLIVDPLEQLLANQQAAKVETPVASEGTEKEHALETFDLQDEARQEEGAGEGAGEGDGEGDGAL